MKSASLLHKKGLTGWNTRDLLAAAAIAVVIAVLLLPLMYIGHSMMAVLGPFGNSLTTGLWVIAGVMVAAIIQRPGAAFLGCALIGLIQGPVSPFGWIILLIQVVVGLCCELPFLLTRYRNYSLPLLLVAGGIANIGPMIVTFLLYFSPLSPSVQLVTFFLHILSGAVGALIAKLLTDALLKTGTLNSFAIGRERSIKV
jgi:energy-coupling factor transport system substrate-specific component